MAENIAVVGAGVGGLATAARLAKQGYSVEVFEKLGECGGRNHQLQDRGFRFDMGPSFMLMPDFFEEVFSYCGQDIEGYLNLRAIDPGYKIFYADGDEITVYQDTARTKDELEKIEKGSVRGFENFMKETRRIYDIARPLLYDCFTLKAILDPAFLSLLGKIRVLESYWHLAKRFFKTEKLCYAFTFESMFMGVSPFDAPAFYSIISYAEHVQKIFHPMGGMYRIPLALEKLARKFGARFQYNAQVKKIRPADGALILDLDGEERVFDKVVVNADYAYAQSTLLQRRIPDYKYSCSAYLVYLGLKRKTQGLAHHNLFFSNDLKKNLRQIFKEKSMPQDPSFYVHVPTATDISLAPAGKEIFYILVPVANLKKNKESICDGEDRLRRIVFDRISAKIGVNLQDLIEVEHRFYPADFIRRYNIAYGATFGLAHNLTQSALFRPPNFDKRIRNLYYVGASTQPGGGLPAVIAGSRIVADLMAGKAKQGCLEATC